MSDAQRTLCVLPKFDAKLCGGDDLTFVFLAHFIYHIITNIVIVRSFLHIIVMMMENKTQIISF